jgi:predicted AAA+ superfamily ATPase
MKTRTLAEKVVALAGQFPVVTLTGPRQSGKTTLARMVFPDHDYVNLEDLSEREFAVSDPRSFLKRFSHGAILDEIQRVPGLLSYIQTIVDGDDSPGRFILTGSQNLLLMSGLSQTLAGRTAIANLLPFSLRELLDDPFPVPSRETGSPPPKVAPPFALEDILYEGFYPRIHDKGLDPHDWLAAYYSTYVERDVRDLANIGNLDMFQRFIRLCAGRTGQILNLTSLGSDCGVSHTTARLWISALQAGFIIHLLQPHHANFSKRLIKSPKLYFLDTGLLCYLLRVRGPGDLVNHPARGQIFESFVLSELLKSFAHRGETPPLYFWRDRTGHEVDFIVDYGTELVPIEAKSGETISASFFDGLRYFTKLGAPASQTGLLIHGGGDLYERDGFSVRPWWAAA